MNLKKLYRVLLICIFCTILSFTGTPALATHEYRTGSYSVQDNTKILIPETYTFQKSLSIFGDFGRLSSPSDLSFDKDGNLYVADTGNNRILKFNSSFQPVLEIKMEANGGFNKPEGVFADSNGSLFIADTENKRIVHCDGSGNFIEEFTKPKSDLIEEDMVFAPSKVAVSDTGIIYVLCKTKFTGLFMIDPNNTFKGYVGANKLSFSIVDVVVRMFGTKEQKRQLARRTPPAATNFSLNDGRIYTVVNNNGSVSINSLNTMGVNLFENSPALGTIAESLSDISASNGIVTVVDDETCEVSQFNEKGDLLLTFGGKGDIKGKFLLPTAVEMDKSGSVYVLDSLKNSIQIFSPTNFTVTLHEASRLYSDGKYEQSREKWEEIKSMDESYILAYIGIGEALYSENKYSEAMEYFKYANAKKEYSTAFDDFEHNMFRDKFTVIVLIAFFILLAVILLIFRLKKYADKRF